MSAHADYHDPPLLAPEPGFTITGAACGFARSNSGSPAGSLPGAAMFPFHDAMRACNP